MIEELDYKTKFDMEFPVENIACFKDKLEDCPHFLILDSEGKKAYIPTYNRIVRVKNKIRLIHDENGFVNPLPILTIKFDKNAIYLGTGNCILTYAKESIKELNAMNCTTDELENKLAETFESHSKLWNGKDGFTIAELLDMENKMHPLFESIQNTKDKFLEAQRTEMLKNALAKEQMQENVEEFFAER